jgi:hypothetical protein
MWERITKEFDARPKIPKSNLKTAAVIAPPDRVTFRVIVQVPFAFCSGAATTTGAISKAARSVAVKTIVSLCALARGVRNMAADADSTIATRTIEIDLLILFGLLKHVNRGWDRRSICRAGKKQTYRRRMGGIGQPIFMRRSTRTVSAL